MQQIVKSTKSVLSSVMPKTKGDVAMLFAMAIILLVKPGK